MAVGWFREGRRGKMLVSRFSFNSRLRGAYSPITAVILSTKRRARQRKTLTSQMKGAAGGILKLLLAFNRIVFDGNGIVANVHYGEFYLSSARHFRGNRRVATSKLMTGR